MSYERKSAIPGICLIVIGLWLLMYRLTRFSSLWMNVYPIALVLFALMLFWEFIRRKNSSSLFWSAFVLAVALFYLLRNFRLIPYLFLEDYWPIFLLAVGIGLLAVFLFRPRDWGVLFPACIFLFLGAVMACQTLFGLTGERIHRMLHLWPLILILAGAGIIANGLQKRSNR